jgi:hypothetical protein
MVIHRNKGDNTMAPQPYPQQPYPAYGYQQPYPQYQQQPVAYAPPPPASHGISKTVIIIIVIVVVLIIVIPIILAGILVVYMQDFSQGPGTITPSVSMISHTFVNNYEGSGTVNGGGWTITVASISGSSTQLSSVNFRVGSGGLWKYTLSGASSSKADLSYTGGTSNKWYLLKGGTASATFMDGSTPKTLSASTAKDLDVGELQTVQGAAIIVVDYDGGGTLNSGDVIFIYSDTNGNSSPEISMGNTFEVGDTTGPYGSVNLS